MIRILVLLLAPLIGGLWLVHMVGQSWSEFAQTRAWLAIAIAPIVFTQLVSVLTARSARPQRPIDPNEPGNLKRVSYKSIALAVSWSASLLWAFLCSNLDSRAAIIFLDDILPILPWLAAAIPIGVLLLERIEGPELDQWYRLGASIAGNEPFRPRDHKTALLTTALKAFFVPLMYGNVILAMGTVLTLGALPSSQTWVAWLYGLGLSMDLVVGTIGYAFACRALGTAVRSVDDSVFGWLVCLICYAPLYQYVQVLTQQTDSYRWSDWLNPSQALYWAWAFLVVFSWISYWLSHTAFGLRFSNLSYRGLVDIGPYRLFRHPAYLSKCLYWWLATVPFYGVLGIGDLMRNIGGLSLLSCIYYLRAKTEERHLSRFDEYVNYSRSIDERWARIRRLMIPTLRKTV